MAPCSNPLKPFGPFQVVNDVANEIVLNGPGSSKTLQEQLTDFEAWLKGHQDVMKQLDRVHDGQLRPYCTLLRERIESTIVPVIEDAIVAVQILIELDGDVAATLLEGLQRRIRLGLEHPPYTGGGFSGA